MRLLWSCMTICVLAGVLFIAGCADQTQKQSQENAPMPEATISSVARFVSYQTLPVRGIGIVAGLYGTGSSECPQNIRKDLEKYIWQQISADEGSINPGIFIDSPNTAVVEVLGIIPAVASHNETFDIIVKPLAGTQTTSLDGGYLYTTQLKEMSRLARIEQFSDFSKSMATAEGPIYTDKINQSKDKTWYVLGGGSSLQPAGTTLVLQQPNLLTANLIRNRVNERFGPRTAIPISSAQITIHIPAVYRDQKSHYLQMVGALLLGESPEIRTKRIQELARRLATESDKMPASIALEAIGKPALNELAKLLDHPDPEVQFYAARTMLNIGDDQPIPVIRKIVLTPGNPYRLDAIAALGNSSKRSDSGPILTNALNDSDIQIRLKAYEMLLKTNSSVVSRKIIAGDFVVDSVICSGKPTIYAYQQKTPRIVLFGSPIQCKRDIFMVSDDGRVTINANANDEYISVSRQHPTRPRVIGPISSGYEVSNFLQALGERAENSASTTRKGLAIPYSDIIPILKKMCNLGIIPADFVQGPPPEMDLLLETLPSIDR